MNRIYSVFTLLLLVSACSQPQTEGQKNEGNIITSESLLEIITMDTVKTCEVSEELILNGKVTFNPQQTATIYPVFGGTVTHIYVETGDYVKKGQILATIRSTEVAEYRKELAEAEQNVLITRRNLQAMEEMHQSGMSSEPEYLQAKQEYITALAEENKLKEIFSIFNFSENSLYDLKSPVTGFVMENNLTKEMLLRSDIDEPVFTISGLEDVWVMAEVYESDISKVREGEHTRIVTLAYPEKPATGTIDKIYNVLDEESKTMQVRIKLPNKDHLLKPGMFATVYVEKKEKGLELPCIDAHCLIFEGGNDYVVISKANQLEIRNVQIHKQHNGRAYIATGIKEGELIVNQNALLVYNALSQE